MQASRRFAWFFVVPLYLACATQWAAACPFCSAVSMTLGEELNTSDAAVIATLIDQPASNDPATGNPTKSKFKIVKALKGEALLKDKPVIEMLYFGTQEQGSAFLLFGVDPKELAWGTPTALTERGIEYLNAVAKLPETTADRLAFFQDYFEDADTLLAGDAFNEFAKAPYADVVQLADKMHRDKLITWIQDEKVPASRRRLYLTMLGMCGKPDDVPLIEGMIKNEDRQARTALDAMIGCYLSLTGVNGLPLIEDLFLKNAKCEYVDTYSAIVALRVMGQETTLIPKERLVGALRHMLDRPQLADLVIPDLARWQDWGSMDKLVDLFKNANEESSWVRVPVVQFLRACPEPKAQDYLKELAQIDPDAVKRATNYLALPGLAGGAPPAAAAASPPADTTAAAPAAEPAAEPSAAEPATPVTEPTAASEPAPTAAAEQAANTQQATVVTNPPGTVIELQVEPAAADSAKPDAAKPTEQKSTDEAKPAPEAADHSSAADAKKPGTAPDWSMVVIVCLVVAAGSAMLFRKK